MRLVSEGEVADDGHEEAADDAEASRDMYDFGEAATVSMQLSLVISCSDYFDSPVKGWCVDALIDEHCVVMTNELG